MQEERNGGLTGRARRARFRTRAARLHAQCLVDEYLEPDPSEYPLSRDIPIRGRSEFLPDATTGTLTVMNRSKETYNTSQLNLPLRHADGGIKKTATVSPLPESREPKLKRSEDPSQTAATLDESEESAIRFSKRRGPSYDLFNLRNFDARRRKRVTLGGFLTGCALGTVAAGLLLLVLRTMIG